MKEKIEQLIKDAENEMKLYANEIERLVKNMDMCNGAINAYKHLLSTIDSGEPDEVINSD